MTRTQRIRRRLRFLWQKVTRGFSDDELWNLDVTIARFVLPRLRRFRARTHGYPGGMTEEEWDDKLREMVWAFDRIANDAGLDALQNDQARINAAMLEFGRHFRDLWD